MPNTVPVTWQVMALLQTQLQAITLAGGYRTNIGASITLEPSQIVDTDVPTACIGLQFERRSILSTQHRRRECVFLIECEVACTYADAQRMASNVAEDVLEVLPSVQRFNVASGITADVEIVEARILTRPEGADVVIAQIELSARINEQL